MKLNSFAICIAIISALGSQNTIAQIISMDTTMIKTQSGLMYSILKNGTGDSAKVGQEVLIYETSSYLNGTILYSNENTNKPIKVRIGAHQATEGEDEGLRGMRVGEVRKLILLPYLCKRSSYPPNISPDSTIVVKVELYKIL